MWTDSVEVAVGNTTAEALAALLKKDLGNADTDPDVLTNYEYLLNALQLGLLNGLEAQTNRIINLEEALKARTFSRVPGGLLWGVREPSASAGPPDLTRKSRCRSTWRNSCICQPGAAMRPGPASPEAMRRQLFMDWIHVKILVGETTDERRREHASSFLSTSSGGELNAVINAGNAAGILPARHEHRSNHRSRKPKRTSRARWTQYEAVTLALQPAPRGNWRACRSAIWVPNPCS
jgi:hypothetical protein